MDRFAGRVAVVTGASSGIGEDIAVLLAEAGLVVVAVARREQRLKELAIKTAASKGKVHPFVADMSKGEDVARLFKWVDGTLGGVSVLVNNAAILTVDPLQDLEPERIHQLVDTNVTAVMLCCREGLNSMKKHGIEDGHIVNINSVLGHSVINGPNSICAYAATKHAITGLTRALRYDAQRLPGFKIRISGISPGGVITDMVTPYLPESVQAVMIHARDVADAVRYVLSCPPNVEISELLIRCPSESY